MVDHVFSQVVTLQRPRWIDDFATLVSGANPGVNRCFERAESVLLLIEEFLNFGHSNLASAWWKYILLGQQRHSSSHDERIDAAPQIQ